MSHPLRSTFRPAFARLAAACAIAAAISLGAPQADAASFDCAKASTFVEKAVCADPYLGHLDEALAENYRRMRSADLGAKPGVLRRQQLEWLKSRDACRNAECVKQAYLARLEETCEYGVVSGAHPGCADVMDESEFGSSIRPKMNPSK